MYNNYKTLKDDQKRHLFASASKYDVIKRGSFVGEKYHQRQMPNSMSMVSLAHSQDFPNADICDLTRNMASLKDK